MENTAPARRGSSRRRPYRVMGSASTRGLERDLSERRIHLGGNRFEFFSRAPVFPPAEPERLLDRLRRLGQRVDAELAAQELAKPLPFNHGGTPRAQPNETLDDRHPRRLPVLVDPRRAPEAGQRRLVLAAARQGLPVLDEHGLDAVAQAALRLLGPRVVDPLERRALGQRGGAGERFALLRLLARAPRLVEGRVELPQVAGEPVRRVEAVELRVAQEERLVALR